MEHRRPRRAEAASREQEFEHDDDSLRARRRSRRDEVGIAISRLSRRTSRESRDPGSAGTTRRTTCTALDRRTRRARQRLIHSEKEFATRRVAPGCT